MRTTRRHFLAASTAALAAGPARAEAPAEKWAPKLSENLADVNPDTLRWLKQLGCKHVIFQGTDGVDRDKKGYWTSDDIRPVKKACDEAGLALESMMIPIDFYLQARLGKPGRDKDVENVCRTIRAAGDEGVPMLEWRFWPDFYWDDRVGYYTTEGRGGAKYKSFD
ncbi:MAG TPA: mannonate dehydratase, partial [Gemmataceae bacterium]|nr:mannonate dehydratase [Gemmataceae bacterium]